MSIEDMVVAVLAGFDRGEFMMRALPGRGREAFEVAGQVLRPARRTPSLARATNPANQPPPAFQRVDMLAPRPSSGDDAPLLNFAGRLAVRRSRDAD